MELRTNTLDFDNLPKATNDGWTFKTPNEDIHIPRND